MALMDVFRKPTAMDKAFADMEDDMSSLVDLDITTPSVDPFDDVQAAAAALADATEEFGQAAIAQDGTRFTAYTQSWMATLASFEDVHRAAQADLDKLASIISSVSAAQHSAGNFLSTVHGNLLRANELERSNAALVSENRRLSQAADRVKRLSSQLETLTEAYRRKEMKFTEDNETLRATIGELQGEMVEMRSERAMMEGERADLLNQIAGKSTALERVTREAELLRERQVNLALDLENAQRRHTEVDRKYTELSAIQSAEHALVFELRAKLAEAEKDVYRLQKALDVSQGKLADTQETLSQLEAETSRREARQSAENQKLRSEVESQRARIDVAGRAQLNADSELTELKQKISELTSENTISAERLATLSAELSAERRLATSLRRDAATSETGSDPEVRFIEAQSAEIDQLRRENDAMRSTLSRLARAKAAKQQIAQTSTGVN